MKEVRITCDKCKLSIEPLSEKFDGQHMLGAETLVTLARVGGGWGHNQVPVDGWHFHYLCFHSVVNAILRTIGKDVDTN